jgi:hypothetical protein
MRALLGMAIALALAWGAPAAAVVITSGDGAGNTTAPPDDPGWDNVVNLNGLTGVYLGNGWVLTANHVGARNMVVDSDVYEPVSGSEVQLQTDVSNAADLLLFQILRDPGLPGVEIAASAPLPGTEVVMIGRGRNRGAGTSACYPVRQGWLWETAKTMRWGTNAVERNGINLSISGTLTRAFSTEFDESLQTEHEAQAATGDSGGAIFLENGEAWELAGIMTAISNWGACNDGAALYGNLTYAGDLSFYLDQIDDITSVPACDDGIDQDGDALVDYPDDPGCDDPQDPFETSDALPCDDGIDNDGDGRVDFDPATFADPGSETTLPSGAGDPGCWSPSWSSETSMCQDGIDNEGDGTIDYDGGFSALGYVAAGPDSNCAGGPWQISEAPGSCGLGAELALLMPPLIWMVRRRR